ncbi:MAG: hypothetical protein NC033_02010 [Clostridiales bacterium]|nr:hypothetical protein [Clostridiales bacterium]
MEKINGYTKDEAQSLVKYVCEGKGQGKTLTRIFEEYAKNSGRAKGSVRNYYYALLRSTDNEEVRKILQNTKLKAEESRPFTDDETDKILKAILKERSKGVSVRRAVLNLAGGDDKLMLRYQNKYRNVLAKQPERIKKLMKDAGYPVTDDGRKAIEDKINSLYDELNASLKEENKRLTAVIKKLTDENFLLRLQVKNLQN